MVSLGSTLRKCRQQRSLTQQRVAAGICAQSMLSAIEHDQYVPNAHLLVRLCQRLDISLDRLSLVDELTISTDDQLNDCLQRYCNAHQYVQLKAYLQRPATLNAVKTATQTQAYYYYLGIAAFQTGESSATAIQDLRFAMQMTEGKQLTVLTRLATVSLAVVLAKRGQSRQALALTHQALAHITDGGFSANLSVVEYLAALVFTELADYPAATAQVMTTITVITDHQASYMLANCYRLLAEIAARQGNDGSRLTALQKQHFLSELFHEKVPEKF